jgi:exodeoxyribonuclease VII large subunit
VARDLEATAGGPNPEAAPRAGTRARPLTVSAVNRLSREILEADLASIYLVGEVSNFKPHSSGHWYFSLKDDRAQISAVMFRYANSLVRFRPADGMKVLARGSITLYEPRGQYQILVETLEPKGLGDLQAAFEQLKAKLRAEGLFDEARKRPLPALPRCVGVATSPTGAAIRDILRVFERRGADLRVLIAPCRVQGAEAAAEIAEALRLLNARDDVEVIIAGRGGGSLEDLWPFNEEVVARAIAASRIPVVSAVGHEVDFTIADFVADVRAPTPSAAAEMVLRSREELAARVAHLRASLARVARLLLAGRRAALDRAVRARGMARVEARLREALQRADDLDGRLRRAGKEGIARRRSALEVLLHRLAPRSLRAEVASRRERLAAAEALVARAARARAARARERLARAAGLLASLSPLAVLERGYAICHDARTGAVLREAAPSLEGGDVRVRLHRGALLCEVRRALREGS